MVSREALILRGGGLVAAWVAWYNLVLKAASQTDQQWGPRWLANVVSWPLATFGKCWASFNQDGFEAAARGDFDLSRQYLIAWHPHGLLTISALYGFSRSFALGELFAKQTAWVGIAPLLFKAPLLSEYLLLSNAKDSFAEGVLERLLSRGDSVAVQPGGLVEQVNTDSKQEKAFFPPNLGFIRLAIKKGVPLLPLYAFGENQLWDTSEFSKSVNRWFFDKFRVGALLMHSPVFGLPTTPLLWLTPFALPSPFRKLCVKWGKAVEVGPAEENPSDERVLEVFGRYCEALTELFDKWKFELLPRDVAERGLEIIYRQPRSRL